jgi:LytS/YehU family sensor histidine kinase
MAKRHPWVMVVLGWLPVWGLFALLIVTAHALPWRTAALIGGRMVLAGTLLSPLIGLVVRWLPWPHPMRAGFLGGHLVGAAAYAALWVVSNSALESVVRSQVVVVIGYTLSSFMVLGVWLYVMQVGIRYALDATMRASRAEAAAAQAQLATLRGQLNPHFLFNALHTVVQLVPASPERATKAAEDLAELLRASLGDRPDIVPLADEWALVQRYLQLEGLRFGERLRVEAAMDAEALACGVPSFALQTLVENAVRHGAAPRVAPTTIAVRARVVDGRLVVVVEDDGTGTTTAQLDAASGTGLRRLRERLVVLHGSTASLAVVPLAQGVRATLQLPAVTA